MNREEVLGALRAAVDPEGEAYKRVSVEYRDLTPEWAERAKAQELAPPVAEVLRRQVEICPIPGDGYSGLLRQNEFCA